MVNGHLPFIPTFGGFTYHPTSTTEEGTSGRAFLRNLRGIKDIWLDNLLQGVAQKH